MKHLPQNINQDWWTCKNRAFKSMSGSMYYKVFGNVALFVAISELLLQHVSYSIVAMLPVRVTKDTNMTYR